MKRAAIIVTVIAAASAVGAGSASAAWQAPGSATKVGTAASRPSAISLSSVTAVCVYNSTSGKNDITVQWTVSTTAWAKTTVTIPGGTNLVVSRPTSGTTASFVDSQPINGGNASYSYTLRAGMGSGNWLSAGVVKASNATRNSPAAQRGRC